MEMRVSASKSVHKCIGPIFAYEVFQVASGFE